jgi:hypothetical protein
MPFLTRAQAIYSRGETVTAVITLVEGLKRDPDQVDAFRWLVDLYCDEVEHSGLEQDIVAVFDACPDPPGVYAYVFKRLARGGRRHLLRQLDKSRRDAASKRGLALSPWTPETDELAFLHPPEQPAELPPAQAEAEVVAAYATAAFMPLQEVEASWDGSGVGAFHGMDPGAGIGGFVQPSLPAPFHPAPDYGHVQTPVPGAPPWQVDRRPEAEQSRMAYAAMGPPEPAPSEGELWEEAVHPALVGRPWEPSARGRREAVANTGEHEVISGSWPRDSGLRDSFASTGSFPAVSPVVGMDCSGPLRNSHRRPVSPEKTKTRRIVVAIAVIIGLAIAALAVYRGFTLATSRSAVGGTVEAATSFDLAALAESEAELAQAAEGDPDSEAVAARLAWTRNLRAWLVGTPAVEAPVIADGSEAHAWANGAAVLGKLTAGDADGAGQMLPEFLIASRAAGIDPGLGAWLQGEIASSRGEPSAARSAYTEGVASGFVPAHVGAIDACLRVGDSSCARKGLDRLAKVAPNHPAIPTGQAAVAALDTIVRSPLDESLPGLAAAVPVTQDRRLARWLVVTGATDAPELREGDMRHFPLLQVSEARRLLRDGQPLAAAAVMKGFDRERVTPGLRTAFGMLAARGFAAAGRPDLALEYVAAIPEGRTAPEFAKDNPEEALARADLLGDVGRLADARGILSALLDHVLLGPEARVVALRLHLAEGRVEDMRRHVDRLGRHRGALVGSALVDLYKGQPGSAAARLGPSTPGSLPDPAIHPRLHRLELRARLLTLAANGRRAEAVRLMESTPVPAALRARVLGPTQGGADLERAIAADPTRLDDQIDIAFVALEGRDFQTAEKWAGRAQEACPGHAEGHLILAKVRLEAGQADAAAQHLRGATRERPDHPVLTVLRAEALAAAGKPASAIQVLKTHLDKSPGDGRAMGLLGQSYFKARRFTLGREDLQARLGRIDAKSHRRASGEARLWIGLLSGSTKGRQRGGANLRLARRLLDDRPDVLLALGNYARERGDNSHAMELYKLASDARTGPVAAHLALGKLAVVRKNRRVAKLALERYLRATPDGDSAGWARRQLEQMDNHPSR